MSAPVPSAATSTSWALCVALDRHRPPSGSSHHELVTFVRDQPGHDRRYAIDPAKVEAEFGWRPTRDFEAALDDTVRSYLDNEAWWRPLRESRGRTSGSQHVPTRKPLLALMLPEATRSSPRPSSLQGAASVTAQ
jgi:hypothetical protein